MRNLAFAVILRAATTLLLGVLPSFAATDPFTLVVVPDTQKYTEKYPRGMINQMEWIVANRALLNSRLVIHEGDIVEHADNAREWQVADNAFQVLEQAQMPYSLCLGNHDMVVDGKKKEWFLKTFPKERLMHAGAFGGFEDVYGGNSYSLLEVGDLKFLIVNLEFAPTENTLTWANEVVASHPEHRVIINTHSFLKEDERNEQGSPVWDGFVKNHPNIFLVLCGHLSVGRRVDRGVHGNVIHQILANYQGHDNGGMGWLRLLRFVPDRNRIEVSTYSTLLNRYMSEGDPKFSDLDENHFQLAYNMDQTTENARFTFKAVDETADPKALYRSFELEGWPILLHPKLEHGAPTLCREVLEELTHQLQEVQRVIPERAVAELKKVPIWIELNHPKHPCMCFHPEAEWLRDNGMNPDKAGAVEIANAQNFVDWTASQPWMVLHELAHAYHFNVLGSDEARLKDAYQAAVDSGHFESVSHVSGKERRHYALTNPMEYFAEATEAYFGKNDFYPFNRTELKTADPIAFELLPKLWGVTPVKATLMRSQKLWDASPHNAFTDLIFWHDRFYCAFREGQKHADDLGTIRVLASSDGFTWGSVASLSTEDYDLRDPKLSVTGEDHLLMIGGAQQGDGEDCRTGGFMSETKDGALWTLPQRTLAPGRWLWALTWDDGVGYGVSYAAPEGVGSSLIRTSNGTDFDTLIPEFLNHGFPNEARLRRGSDGQWLCLHRRDKEDAQAYLGMADQIEGPWTWKNLHRRVGGPNMLETPFGWIAVVRLHRPEVHTEVCLLDPKNGELTPLLALPSGGDTSYAGMVWKDGRLWVSYYSSHESKTAIYLADVAIERGL